MINKLVILGFGGFGGFSGGRGYSHLEGRMTLSLGGGVQCKAGDREQPGGTGWKRRKPAAATGAAGLAKHRGTARGGRKCSH